MMCAVLLILALVMVCRTVSEDRLYSDEYILSVHNSGYRRITEVTSLLLFCDAHQYLTMAPISVIDCFG